jgi:uncharacterized coiled-coil protein SlyX
MRELDALNGVKAGQTRELAKQTKVIERLVESEKSLNRQLVRLPVYHFRTYSLYIQSHMEKESQLQARAISERDAMIANANLQTEREQAQLELSNRRIKEVRSRYDTLPSYRR